MLDAEPVKTDEGVGVETGIVAFTETVAAALLVVGTGIAVLKLEDDTGKTLVKTVGLHMEIVKTLMEYPLGRAVVALAAAVTLATINEEVVSGLLEVVLEEAVLARVEVDDEVDLGMVMVL